MRNKLFAVAILIGISGQAHADWEMQKSDDPMTDEKMGLMTTSNDDGYTIGLQCWNNKDMDMVFGIKTGKDYDKAAIYQEKYNLRIRIDKNQPVNLKFEIHEVHGKIDFLAAPMTDETFFDFARQLFKTNKTIAIDLGSFVTVFKVTNTTGTASKMEELCKPRDS